MTEHTPEPWHVYNQPGGGQTAISSKRTHGITEGIAFMDAVLIGPQHSAKRLANARRIVACVNACEGISTEELEQHEPARSSPVTKAEV